MSKKPHSYAILSSKHCVDCNRLLKLNLVEKYQDKALRCWKCHRALELTNQHKRQNTKAFVTALAIILLLTITAVITTPVKQTRTIGFVDQKVNPQVDPIIEYRAFFKGVC